MSSDPDKTKEPSDEKLTHFTGAVWLFIYWAWPSTVLFQRRTVWSSEQDATIDPWGFTATSWTGPLWPMNLKGLREGLKFHTITVPSREDEITYFKLGLKAIDVIDSLCPLKDLLRDGSPKPAKYLGN